MGAKIELMAMFLSAVLLAAMGITWADAMVNQLPDPSGRLEVADGR